MSKKPIVIVTGASRGLGAAIACWLAKAGSGVTLIARSGQKLKKIAEAVNRLGGEPLICKADVCDSKACRRAVEQTLEHFGRLDALVNNAGIVQPISSITMIRASAGRCWKFSVRLYPSVAKILYRRLGIVHR
jgi:NAD(P)-dependent dehydrogenase (short-subunit alcohol dehydrogenase family)